MHKLQVHISNNISRCSCIIPNKIEQNFRRTQSKSLQRKSPAIERNRTQNVCVSSMPERNRIIERTRFKPYNDCSFSALATEKWNPSVTFLLAVSSWRWNSCSRENRDYFGKATSKEIRRARESELIYYATIHWLSWKLENNRDDSQDDLELAINLKLKDFSLVNKHNLLRPNSKTEWSMWYAGKIARQHSNCVDVWIIRLSRPTFNGNFLTWL